MNGGRRATWAVVVVALYAALAVLCTWPLVTYADRALLAGSNDTLLHYWNCWWVRQALREGVSPFYTPYLFYPYGASLVTHNIPWLNALLTIPLEPLVGALAAYNLSILVTLTLCGYCAYLLLRDLTHSEPAALVGGVLYEVWPYRLGELGHPNMLSTHWIPLALLLLIRLLRRPRWQTGALLGLVAGLIGYTRWQQLLGAAIVLGIYFLFQARTLWRERRALWAPLLIAICVAGVLLAPPAMLLLRNQQAEATHAVLVRDEAEDTAQTDLLGFITPPEGNWLVGEYTRPLFDRYYRDNGDRVYPTYLGLVPAILALLGALRLRRKAWPWLTMLALLIALSLGADLRVGGRFLRQIPTLYDLVHPLVVFRLIRFPMRYAMFVALPLASLAAYGIATVHAWLRPRRAWLAALAPAVLGAAILAEYLQTPIPLQPIGAPDPFFVQLAQEPAPFAVMDLPIERNGAKMYMFDQVTHGKYIVQGHLSRMPENPRLYNTSHPEMRFLAVYGPRDFPATEVYHHLETMAQDGIRYITLRRGLVEPKAIRYWQHVLPIQPRYQDSVLVAYATTPELGRDCEVTQELAPSLGLVASRLATESYLPGEVIAADVVWGARSAQQPGQRALLELASPAGVVARSAEYPLAEGDDWRALSTHWAAYELEIPAAVAPGNYQVTLVLRNGAADSLGRVALGWIALGQIAPVLGGATPSMAAHFGQELRLHSALPEQGNDQLTVAMHWQGLRHMRADYTVFVHVFDRTTGQPVAQYDRMPAEGKLPTTHWWPGEELKETITLPLAGIPSGQYGIAVGLYTWQDGQRLPVWNAQGQLLPDGRLVLPETVTIPK